MTKAEFITEADAICKRADRAQERAVKANSKQNPTQSELEEQVRKYGLPPIRAELTELSELEPPPGDKAKIDELLGEIEKALRRAEANPGSVLAGAGPFASAEETAREYGFKVCDAPT